MIMSVTELIDGIKKAHKAGDRWELEPGEPFYCAPTERIIAPGEAGPEVTTFIRAFDKDGTEVPLSWESQKPARLSHERKRIFTQTPNAVLLGRDDTVLVSSGRFGLRERRADEREYIPYDEWYALRTEAMRDADRTVENRPAWAEIVSPIAAWGTVDYQLRVGDFLFTQRLESDGQVSEARGSFGGIFKTPTELRTIAGQALEMAERLEAQNELDA